MSTTITIFTIFFLLCVLSAFSIISFNLQRIVSTLNAEFDVQVFLSNALNSREIEALQQELGNLQGVKNVIYISKEKAAEEFKKEFGDDIFDVLEENPLPASFVVLFEEQSIQKQQLTRYAEEWESKTAVDEVVLRNNTLDRLVKFSKISKSVLLILFFIVLVGSFFMVSNTIRLIIIARHSIIYTMELVGATRAFIRRPYIYQGILQGFLGGLLSCILIFIIASLLDLQWPGMVIIPPLFYLSIIAAGLIFGLSGSLFAIKRYL